MGGLRWLYLFIPVSGGHSTGPPSKPLLTKCLNGADLHGQVSMTDGGDGGGRRTGKGIFSTPCRQATILQSSKCENSGNEHKN